MGRNLYWRPVHNKHALPDRLKKILAWGFWRQDADKKSSIIVLDSGHESYLLGLSDARIPGAKELVDQIHKYSQIEIFIA